MHSRMLTTAQPLHDVVGEVGEATPLYAFERA